MINIPLYLGLQLLKVVQDFFHPQYFAIDVIDVCRFSVFDVFPGPFVCKGYWEMQFHLTSVFCSAMVYAMIIGVRPQLNYDGCNMLQPWF